MIIFYTLLRFPAFVKQQGKNSRPMVFIMSKRPPNIYGIYCIINSNFQNKKVATALSDFTLK